MILLAGDSGGEGGGILGSLPDPMKLDLLEVGFVIALLVGMYFFLKHSFFSPLGKLMDDREAEILAGASVKADVAKEIEARQSEYAEKLKSLRSKAFEHRKGLAQAATLEKNQLIDKARQDASVVRKDAGDLLVAQREAAKSELEAQVNALADSMVQHLLKQA
jgi:F-type H+-transporting ATPase subunit b